MAFWKRPPWQPKSRLGVDRVDLPPDPPMHYPSAGPLAPPGLNWSERVTGGNGTSLWTCTAAGPDEALAVWEQWREVHEVTGWWPILADWDFWPSVDKPVTPTYDLSGTGADWLSSRLYGGADPLAERMPRGLVHWPSAGTARSRTEIQNYLAATEIVLVPAPAGWLVPEILSWSGAENLGVSGAQHTLVLRRWAGLWGAEPQGMGSDELVLRVLRPPKPKDEAWSAALELAAYCPELVRADQDSTLEDLAGTMTSGIWDIMFDLSDDQDDQEDDGDDRDDGNDDDGS